MGFVLGFAIASLVTGACWFPSASQARQEDTGDGAGVRIVHGIADAGPLDVYVDGAIALIGIVFAETSGDLLLQPGGHEFAVVPTGDELDGAVAEGSIVLEDDTRYYATLVGLVDGASVGLFAVDDRALDAGRARFRVISGVPDAGEVVPVFAGGDALSAPLAFGDASEYAAIDAGVYDLDVLDAISGASLLTLPQTPLAEGTATDVILVGQASDGTLQAVVSPISVDVARVSGRAARILAGTCDETGDLVAELGVVQVGQGEVVGASDTTQVAQGFGLAAVPFATLVASPHVIAVAEDDEQGGAVVACGAVGGALTDTGALVIALHTAADAPGGIGVLAPALEDPESTGVSVFLTVGVTSGSESGTPEPASG